jgi:hypothetical protein
MLVNAIHDIHSHPEEMLTMRDMQFLKVKVKVVPGLTIP